MAIYFRGGASVVMRCPTQIDTRRGVHGNISTLVDEDGGVLMVDDAEVVAIYVGAQVRPDLARHELMGFAAP